MEKIMHISGKAIPLDMDDVDTDLIIPAQYLTSISRAGYGKNLFIRLRQSDQNFIFNQPQFANACILISGENFGCGSSREHAVWALQEAGIRAVIAVSFGDIFFANSGKNGLILIQLTKTIIQILLKKALGGNSFLDIDITQQKITVDQQEVFEFQMDPFRKHCFMNGLDDLQYLLSYQKQIESFEKRHAQEVFISGM